MIPVVPGLLIPGQAAGKQRLRACGPGQRSRHGLSVFPAPAATRATGWDGERGPAEEICSAPAVPLMEEDMARTRRGRFRRDSSHRPVGLVVRVVGRTRRAHRETHCFSDQFDGVKVRDESTVTMADGRRGRDADIGGRRGVQDRAVVVEPGVNSPPSHRQVRTSRPAGSWRVPPPFRSLRACRVPAAPGA